MPRKETSNWISLREACRILEMDTDAFLRHIASTVTRRQLPGMHVQYLRADVERVASEAVQRPSGC